MLLVYAMSAMSVASVMSVMSAVSAKSAMSALSAMRAVSSVSATSAVSVWVCPIGYLTNAEIEGNVGSHCFFFVKLFYGFLPKNG